MFIRSDSYLEALLPALEKIHLSQRMSEECGRGRLNWDYIATEMLELILSEFNAKMVPVSLVDAFKKDAIYTMEIKPAEGDSYGDVKNPLKSVINIDYLYSSGKNVFNGTVSELSNFVDMKFHVKNKVELILARINLSKDEQLKMLADIMATLLPYGENFIHTFDETDYGTLTVKNHVKD